MPTRTPFRILVSTVLSTRTQDPVTAAASARLFAVASDSVKLARLKPVHIERLIHPVGFYRTKARLLPELARVLIERSDGAVPDTLKELLGLPGVGRKVANIVLSRAFGKPAIAVDTHVHRISNRLGLVRSLVPEKTEARLAKLLPRRYWIEWNYLLVAHGQTVCRPIGPKCDACPLRRWCRRVGVSTSRRRRPAVRPAATTRR
jgi:endonuclease-3